MGFCEGCSSISPDMQRYLSDPTSRIYKKVMALKELEKAYSELSRSSLVVYSPRAKAVLGGDALRAEDRGKQTQDCGKCILGKISIVRGR